MLHQKRSTMDVIQRRNPTCCLCPNRCISCKSTNEDVNHLFTNYPKAMCLWNKLQTEIKFNIPLSRTKDLCFALCQFKATIPRASSASTPLLPLSGQFGQKEITKSSMKNLRVSESNGKMFVILRAYGLPKVVSLKITPKQPFLLI